MLKGIITRLEEKLNNWINIKSFEKNLILKLKNSNLAYPNTFMFKIFRLIKNIYLEIGKILFNFTLYITFSCSDKNS